MILPLIVELIFVLTILFSLYPVILFIITALSVVIYVTTTGVVTEWRQKYFKAMAMKDAEYNQKATDSLLNFETVKYFNAEKHEEDRFLKSLGEYRHKNVAVAKSLVVLNINQSGIISLGLVSVLMIAAIKIVSGEFKVGDFVMINMFILQIYVPLNLLGWFYRTIRDSMTDVELVFELLEIDEVIKESKNPLPIRIQGGEIEFRDVSFTYDKKLPPNEQKMIIKHLSFKVPAGKSVAIVGSTGSGKSTIMRLLYRFYDIDAGQIFIDGQDISELKLTDLRAQIAIVPQDCVLFNDTIMYNIAYGGVNDPKINSLMHDPKKEEELIDAIKESAVRSQIHDFIMTKQKNYLEKVGERGLKLSGGEKQRVAIARALLKNSAIMCFDEATSALDTSTEREIQRAIEEVSKGSTTLMIAHRLSTVRNCDLIIVLKHGQIVESGTHDQLLQQPDGEYKILWEKQSE